MSLDVCLSIDEPILRQSTGIFVRRNGAIVEISQNDWDEMCPGHEPTVCDPFLDTRQLYWANITHNLSPMAKAAGIYTPLWHPEQLGITKAAELIGPLRVGLRFLRKTPEVFRRYDSPNGWGLYQHFVPFVENYLRACETHPLATVTASR